MTSALNPDLNERPWHAEIAWQPDDSYIGKSRLARFITETGQSDLDQLREWAIADIGRYWDAVVQDLGLSFAPPYRQAVDLTGGAAWPVWFVDGGFNYAAAALDANLDRGRSGKNAVIWEGDDGAIRTWTYAELHAETHRVAQGLRALGLTKGDRVGIFMPMIPETVAAVLACAVVGAVFTPLFSGYAADAIANRLEDAGATVLITVDSCSRRGRDVPMKSIADQAVEQVDTIRSVVVCQRSGSEIDWAPERDVWWHELVAAADDRCVTEPTSANDPFMILYTSGTTGRPKGALHVHAGFPIKAAHDLAYCFDLQPDDVLFWLTDLGWMMGPWLIAGGLMLGSTIVLFEGTPDYPGPDRLWQISARHRVTVLGVAPTAVRSLVAQGDDLPARHDLSALRVLGSTGEPWNPDPWRWYFDQIGGGRCPIINYSGGTETGGGIVGCTTIEPIKPCGFSGPVPGMDADVVDDTGHPVRGAVGELVVRQPWVGMTSGFWQDSTRYEETYWSRFPDTWVHGDWAEIDDDGFWYIRGRSDDTLNVAGKRIGPAEIESAAVSHVSVREAAAIGVPDPIKGEVIWVFAVLNGEPDDANALARDVTGHVASQLGSSFRPAGVRFVADLPRTRNAKVMRRVIRAAFLGLPPGDITALENPGAVEEIARQSPSATAT